MSPAAYAVLGAISLGPTHGFAIARRLQPTGDLGQVWSLTRPLVYRELTRLVERDLVREQSGEAGDRWLAEPVERVRDFRSMFLLKLALIDGSGHDPRPLARAQRARFAHRVQQIEAELQQSEGFEARVVLWRLVSTRAAIDFLDTVIDRTP